MCNVSDHNAAIELPLHSSMYSDLEHLWWHVNTLSLSFQFIGQCFLSIALCNQRVCTVWYSLCRDAPGKTMPVTQSPNAILCLSLGCGIEDYIVDTIAGESGY